MRDPCRFGLIRNRWLVVGYDRCTTSPVDRYGSGSDRSGYDVGCVSRGRYNVEAGALTGSLPGIASYAVGIEPMKAG